mmetsp:Transcript_23187/g.36260  ORF Transcript_23187/g.36260 Transcript_23187/m.36260 type:complete len:137 (+) Transcript_23187:905-1315(+)
MPTIKIRATQARKDLVRNLTEVERSTCPTLELLTRIRSHRRILSLPGLRLARHPCWTINLLQKVTRGTGGTRKAADATIEAHYGSFQSINSLFHRSNFLNRWYCVHPSELDVLASTSIALGNLQLLLCIAIATSIR